MKFAIVISKQDTAGMNIARHLDLIGIKYHLLECDSIDADNLDVDGDFVIFATKHRSEKGDKSLTCHAPGNWKGADFGGEEGKVCRTSALFMKYLFLVLNEETKKKNWEYDISMECTHHGPLIEKPCCFIEIGSNEDGWGDEKAGKIIAGVLKRVLNENFFDENAEPVLGIGGPHYCPNFNKIQLNTNYAVGHVIPQYVFPVTKEMIKEAVEKTEEKISKVIIDWKGCGVSKERDELIKLIEDLGLEVVRSDMVDK